MSLLINARMKNSVSPVQINITTSKGGKRSEIPRMSVIMDGIVAQCIKTIATHPTVSEDSLVKYSTKSNFIRVISNCICFVKDVSSNLGDSWFVPTGVDVVSMVK